MARVEITLDQARKNASSFMYIFASDEFLARLQPEWARKIRIKRENQKRVLALSARKYLGNANKWQQFGEQVRAGFIEKYGIAPDIALVKLAKGERVAGKNWQAGVFGIGATKRSDFKGTGVSVDPTTGEMILEGKKQPITETIYEDGKPYQIVWRNDEYGVTYVSQVADNGKWYANSYSDVNTGTRWNANGKEISDDEAGSFWENVAFDWDDIIGWIEKIINWLLGSSSKEAADAQTLTAKNTLPSQTKDGFVQQSGFSETGAVLLALAAGGALLAGGIGGKSKKK